MIELIMEDYVFLSYFYVYHNSINIEELDVSGCSGITSTSVDELRACGVSVKVNHLGSLNEFPSMDEIAQSNS